MSSLPAKCRGQAVHRCQYGNRSTNPSAHRSARDVTVPWALLLGQKCSKAQAPDYL